MFKSNEMNVLNDSIAVQNSSESVRHLCVFAISYPKPDN